MVKSRATEHWRIVQGECGCMESVGPIPVQKKMIALWDKLFTLLKGEWLSHSFLFLWLQPHKAPLWLTHGNLNINLNGAFQRVRSFCFLLTDITSVEVAKFWLKRTFSTKLWGKLLKVSWGWKQRLREKRIGRRRHSHADKFSNKKHISVQWIALQLSTLGLRDKGCGEVMVIHLPSVSSFLSTLSVSFGVILLFNGNSH